MPFTILALASLSALLTLPLIAPTADIPPVAPLIGACLRAAHVAAAHTLRAMGRGIGHVIRLSAAAAVTFARNPLCPAQTWN